MPRIVYLLIGCVFVGLGFIGAFLPLLPTVPFLLLALWCFARSSQRFHDWLYHHPRFGPPLREWDQHGVIPVRAKILSTAMMAVSMAIMLAVTDLSAWAYGGIAAVLLCVSLYILSRPGRPPDR
ncbi:MAG: hypothetical protein CMM78_08280 [Rhodospirillaceae bacterium]|jgi:uncharacterized membrane protein YbaN (DUF454 family)|uniref:YbaN family protein n=1 Tax=Hwanghaeella sp. 1Z406 TaxID=3402811 RepID=UPI000C4170F6|nr:hypothetical protein [Rhodospirillales bacterium]MAX48190.1 hypothetical protein [Rhodospirillaceae bacterium]|tara:strand:+ start:39525 stop:39896 length:372 start_codon:yes stop_codon:yes gene_type:complete